MILNALRICLFVIFLLFLFEKWTLILLNIPGFVRLIRCKSFLQETEYYSWFFNINTWKNLQKINSNYSRIEWNNYHQFSCHIKDLSIEYVWWASIYVEITYGKVDFEPVKFFISIINDIGVIPKAWYERQLTSAIILLRPVTKL